MSTAEIHVDELAARLRDGARLVDVRETDEYVAGHVPGAVHVPLAQVPENIGQFMDDDGAAVYVICKSGGRSARACEFLQSSGLDVVNVVGGVMAWVMSDRDVVSGVDPE